MCSSIGLVLIALTVLVVQGHGFILGEKIGMYARIIATAAIYQKVERRGGGKGVSGRERSEREGRKWRGGRNVRRKGEMSERGEVGERKEGELREEKGWLLTQPQWICVLVSFFRC